MIQQDDPLAKFRGLPWRSPWLWVAVVGVGVVVGLTMWL
jgi:hypothetical protein